MKRKYLSLLSCLLLLVSFVACKKEANSNSVSKDKIKLPSKSGVSESGYAYTIYGENTGQKPIIGDEVTYHQLLTKNDSIVSSTYLNFEPVTAVMPTKDKVADPPPPSYEAILLLGVGDSIAIEHDMSKVKNYQRPGWLKPTDKLTYQIKLLNIRSKALVDAEQDSILLKTTEIVKQTSKYLEDFKSKKLKYDKSKTGLGSIIHNVGNGKQVENKKYIQFHYVGMNMDGEILDNTLTRFLPINYRVGNGGVKGWDEILPQLKEGGSATVFIPSELAYGKKGRKPKIKPNEDLVFYVEVVKVN